jgi:hypothetical protein
MHQVAVLTRSQPLADVIPMQGYNVTGGHVVLDRG